MQAGRSHAGKAQQHGLAPRRAERSQRRLAHDLAGEPVGHDQAFALGQQRQRKVAIDCEIEAVAERQVAPAICGRPENPPGRT